MEANKQIPYQVQGSHTYAKVPENHIEKTAGFSNQERQFNLPPLKLQSEKALRGHFTLAMIAAAVNVSILNQMNQTGNRREELFMTLRNQNCSLLQTKIMMSEPQRKSNEFYKLFAIQCPLSFDIPGKGGKTYAEKHNGSSRKP